MSISRPRLCFQAAFLDVGKWQKISALLGSFLFLFSIGSYHTVGNLLPYLVSYMRHVNPESEVTYENMFILNASIMLTFGLGYVFSAWFNMHTSFWTSYITGSLLFSIGTVLTPISMKTNIYIFALIYGVVRQLGVCITSLRLFSFLTLAFPGRSGLAVGFALMGMSLGAVTYIQLQTWFINPTNLPVDVETNVFTQEDILDRIPQLFLSSAALYFTLQVSGMFLIFLSRRNQVKESAAPSLNDSNYNSLDSFWEVFKTKEVYIIWTTRFYLVLVYTAFAGYYKVFGQTVIRDDHFLSVTGSLSLASQALGMILLGWLADRFSFKTVIIGCCVAAGILSATFSWATVTLGKFGLSIWTCLFYMSTASIFVSYPAVPFEMFGLAHGGGVLGFLGTSSICSFLLWTVNDLLLNWAGWPFYFVTVGAPGVIPIIAALFL